MPYRGVKRVSGWGCQFDSLTELKYAMSIMEDYYFLRSPVSIYYHPGTKITIDQVRRCHLRYTPDFLIRHKQTFEAYLIEIKPRVFQNHPQLVLRKAIAENYIARKRLDWRYKVVFDDEVILNSDQLDAFNTCPSLHTKQEVANWFNDYCLRVGHTFPDNLLTDLVISGPSAKTPKWKQMRLL
ncbi:hypothetical protein CLV53_11844 [Sediminibacterium magnilacihabitans]|jgi:hypothetical protein|nr:hypothetical protein CLV53_11844 [Sediminibacterium magnilacihabitans]